MEWPETLKLDPGAKKAIERAVETNPVPGNWPEGTVYVNADQAREMAGPLIEAFHTHLTNARIAFLFKQHVGGRSQSLAGKATVTSAKIKHLSDVDFVIEINWTMWIGMSVPTRTALLDHELEHCGVDDKENWCIISHDIEEFHTIVARHGLWQQNVKTFADVCTTQLELLTAPA